MIHHVVLWKLLDGENGKSKEENFQLINGLLSALPPLIPELRSLSVVKNENPVASNMDVALLTTFDNMEDLNTYVNHPEHVKVGPSIRSAVSARSAIDYQI